MHGNVGEWVWDYYGEYPAEEQTDPAGPASGTLRVYRGGGWNDFAKNMRCTYRATLEQNKGSFNIGVRLARNAAPGTGSVSGAGAQAAGENGDGKILIAYFSWGGNTKGVAEEIRRQTVQTCLNHNGKSLFQRLQHRFGRSSKGTESTGTPGACKPCGKYGTV